MNPTLRTILFWCHLTAGVVAGIVILIMSVTGVLLAYERQMLEWADTRGLEITAPTGAQRLSTADLLERVRAARPNERPVAVTLRANPGAPVAVNVGARTLQVDPYTGQVLGEGATSLRAFFRSVTEWHRYLAMSGESRTTGRAITGASNLAFLFIVASGPFLWWPKNAAWRQFRQILLFRGGLRGKARDFNWHNVIGVWSAVPLIVIVFGGSVISYPWMSDLVYTALGEAPPPRLRPGGPPPGAAAEGRPGGRGAGPRSQAPASNDVLAGVDRALAAASQREPSWRTLTVRLPNADSQPVTVAVDTGTGGQPQLRSTLVVNQSSGAIEREERYADQSVGRRARSWLRFAHTGEVYGLVGQTIAGAVSLGGVVLVWTGLALALRRFVGWTSRGKNASSLRAA